MNSSSPVETFFDVIPELPALEAITLALPGDSAPFSRGYVRCELARRMRRLRVGVTSLAAGLALAERPHEDLEHLDLSLAVHSPKTSPRRRSSSRSQHRDRFTPLETLAVRGDRFLEPDSLAALCTSVANVRWEPHVSSPFATPSATSTG